MLLDHCNALVFHKGVAVVQEWASLMVCFLVAACAPKDITVSRSFLSGRAGENGFMEDKRWSEF